MKTPDTLLTALPVTADAADISAALPVYREFLSGRAAVLPVSPDDTVLPGLLGAGDPDRPVRPGTLVACTSGSTGTPKGALLRTDGVLAAVRASASFIARRTGHGPGPWLLALPPHHIAGTMVILRSLDAGHDPAVLGTGPFTVARFASATAELVAAHPDLPRYTSLVPTQLLRLLDDPAGVDALSAYAAVLVGGGPTPPAAVRRCAEAGVPVLLTYGSSETSGGVLYNGEPLPGYRVHIADPDGSWVGRVELSGPSVADGYRVTAALDPAVAADAFPRPGVFRTSDLGRLDAVGGSGNYGRPGDSGGSGDSGDSGDSGSSDHAAVSERTDGVGGTDCTDCTEVLTVLGRADGAVNSGGLKILPEQVEAVLADAGVTACAVGMPDPEWGEVVAVLVEGAVPHHGEDVTGASGADGPAGTTDTADTADTAGTAETPDTAPTDCTAALRNLLTGRGVASHLVPKLAVSTDVLPRTGPGKLDRIAVRDTLRKLVRGASDA